MVKRFAAHYLFLLGHPSYKLSYVEVSDDNRLVYTGPLRKEMAGTAFYNGIIVLSAECYVPGQLISLIEEKAKQNPSISVFGLLQEVLSTEVVRNDRIYVYLLDGIDLLAAEFGTNDGCCYGYIQRLC